MPPTGELPTPPATSQRSIGLPEKLLGEPIQTVIPMIEVVGVAIHMPDVRDVVFLEIRWVRWP